MYPLKIQEKYDRNNLWNLTHRFWTVYLWNYIPWDTREFVWSHPWVDISPITTAQEVFCVLDWEVIKVWEDWAYWKHVFIKHTNAPNPDNMSKTTTLYSCYEHLSEILVWVWNILKEWTIIWKTWNTWISFWEHLHFQIDRDSAPDHAYWPYSWAEAQAAWVSFSGWVDIWLWLDKAKAFTINPLEYLDMVDAYRWGNYVKPNIEIPKENTVSTPVFNSSNDTSKKFSDIDPNAPFAWFLNELYSAWLIKWYWDNTFKPNNLVTRWEFLKIIYAVKPAPLTTDNTNYFLDINDSMWQKPYINTCVELGIISKDNKYFRPNDNISRVEALKIAILLYVWTINEVYSQSFSDVQANDWSAPYVEYAVKHWLLDANWSFYPSKPITRMELVQICARLKGK